MIKVAIAGAHGRMGKAAVQAVRAAADMQLVAQLGRSDSLEEMVAAGATHMVDLTVPEATEANVKFAIQHGIHAVVGTSGWSETQIASLRSTLENHPEVGVLIAPNFALGAVLAMQFAEQAARFFESAEVIETHHPDKLDAPSGTAANTARKIASARTAAGVPASPDATASDPLGARGGNVNDVRVHSVRLRGYTASQEVLLGNPGEVLTIRHDSFDRESFMPGILLGLRRVSQHKGLTVGLENFLYAGDHAAK